MRDPSSQVLRSLGVTQPTPVDRWVEVVSLFHYVSCLVKSVNHLGVYTLIEMIQFKWNIFKFPCYKFITDILKLCRGCSKVSGFIFEGKVYFRFPVLFCLIVWFGVVLFQDTTRSFGLFQKNTFISVYRFYFVCFLSCRQNSSLSVSPSE